MGTMPYNPERDKIVLNALGTIHTIHTMGDIVNNGNVAEKEGQKNIARNGLQRL